MPLLYRKSVLQEVEVVQIFEGISADARDAVGVEQEELKRSQAVEDASRKFTEPVSVQDPASSDKRKEK